MARPKIEINWKIVDQYLVAGATGTEVAAVLGIHPETLYNKCKKEHKIGFTEYSKQKKAKGDSLLKVKQFEMAMSGDRGMLIWLGKNRLDQSDKKDIDHTSKGEKIQQNIVVLPQNDLSENSIGFDEDAIQELIDKAEGNQSSD